MNGPVVDNDWIEFAIWKAETPLEIDLSSSPLPLEPSDGGCCNALASQISTNDILPLPELTTVLMDPAIMTRPCLLWSRYNQVGSYHSI
jgi:hypothetical protein